MQEFEGRTAFVTGGASGIGLAMAQRFTAEGMRVVIADVEDEALEAAVADLRARNANVLGIKLDVRDRDAWAAAADEVEAAFGPVHVLCNNAGVGAGGPIGECTYNDWDWTLDVNVGGVVNGIQTFMQRMLANGEPAHIVNTASMAGIGGPPGMAIYSASKFAVVGMSEAMAADLAETPVNVSVLCPGFVKTRIFESGRNRPADLENETPREVTPEQEAMAQALMADALPPEHVAECVMDAMREDRFWIFTHPEYEDGIRMRTDAMLSAFQTGPKLGS